MTTHIGETATQYAQEQTVLTVLTDMLRELLDEYGLDDTDITMDTGFHNDLELESIDLVTLSSSLQDHYGDQANFAAFIAERDLDEIIALTVGDLVRYVVTSLHAADTDQA